VSPIGSNGSSASCVARLDDHVVDAASSSSSAPILQAQLLETALINQLGY
jgi:hypothetical protein